MRLVNILYQSFYPLLPTLSEESAYIATITTTTTTEYTTTPLLTNRVLPSPCYNRGRELDRLLRNELSTFWVVVVDRLRMKDNGEEEARYF